VLVADQTYHGNEPLTYAADLSLPRGQLVTVPLRSKQVLGVVMGTVKEPHFAVKTMSERIAAPPLPPTLLSLLEWMRTYYPAPLGITTQLFLPKGVPKKPFNASLPEGPKPALPPLTTEQQSAIRQLAGPGLHLLHGETGSGKTRVYIELARQALAKGKSAIILTPEIGLTSQLASDFAAVFGERVLVVHSGLTDAARERLWFATLNAQQPLVVIGARSALFSPLAHVGLMVVDEAHETAYKQDQAPYYHATTVAAKRASLEQATLVLGSATPLVSDYYITQAKQRPLVRMLQPAIASDFSPKQVRIVDLRDRGQFTKSSFLSSTLLEAMAGALKNQEQTLLFLNRRGTARVIFCDACGWQAACPHCDLPLVYHGDAHIMRCHSCEYKTSVPPSCPVCHNASVVFKSIGTKAVADEAARLFPGARIMRFDTDNKKGERIEQHYDAVRRGEVDILVGTQTLAKGLDLPKLSLVGVVMADTSLYFPDFTAQERTYQLLSQVLGRVGRGHRFGQAVVQTYNPESPLLQAILGKQWDLFYQAELQERRTYNFPPFCYLLKLSCRRASVRSAQTTSTQLAEQLTKQHPRVQVEGPAPAFHEKVQGKFTWQLIVKARQRSELVTIIHDLPANWSYDIDPMNLL